MTSNQQTNTVDVTSTGMENVSGHVSPFGTGPSSGGNHLPSGFGIGIVLPPQQLNTPSNVSVLLSHSEAKPETFSGVNFKR